MIKKLIIITVLAMLIIPPLYLLFIPVERQVYVVSMVDCKNEVTDVMEYMKGYNLQEKKAELIQYSEKSEKDIIRYNYTFTSKYSIYSQYKIRKKFNNMLISFSTEVPRYDEHFAEIELTPTPVKKEESTFE